MPGPQKCGEDRRADSPTSPSSPTTQPDQSRLKMPKIVFGRSDLELGIFVSMDLNREVSPENWQYLYYQGEKLPWRSFRLYATCFSPKAGTLNPWWSSITKALLCFPLAFLCLSKVVVLKLSCPNGKCIFTLAASQSCISDVSYSQVQQWIPFIRCYL